MNFKGKIALFVATGANVGKIPFAPGTFGSLLGLMICFLLSLTSVPVAAMAAIVLILVSVWASEHAEKIMGKKDPGSVVIDEVAGMVITMVGIPFGPLTATSGFILFRLLDIIKPPPVRFFQDDLPGGAGIVMDDVAAGIIANILLQVICLVFGGISS
jgi:phosphatidylglycerophosphatase A